LRKILSDSMQKRLEIQSGELGNAMTDNERIIEKVAREAYDIVMENYRNSATCPDDIEEVLTRTMLPILDAGQALADADICEPDAGCFECNLERPKRIAWKAARQAFLEGNDGK